MITDPCRRHVLLRWRRASPCGMAQSPTRRTSTPAARSAVASASSADRLGDDMFMSSWRRRGRPHDAV